MDVEGGGGYKHAHGHQAKLHFGDVADHLGEGTPEADQVKESAGVGPPTWGKGLLEL